MCVKYNAHLPTLSPQKEENSRTILAGTVLYTLHGHIICKNSHLCGVFWEDCERKNSHVPTPPEVATDTAGLPKKAWKDCHERLQPSGGRPSSPRKLWSQMGLTPTGKCSRLSGWTAKLQITGSNIILSKSSVSNPVVPVKGFSHPTSTPSPAIPVSST